MIVDDHYHVAASVHSTGTPGINDMHEYQVLPGGKSALISVYSPVQRDLTAWNVSKGLGWILEAGFQEIEIDTGKPLFVWKALDHVGLDECMIPAQTTDKFNTWDFFHLNSVDKFANGDYLISGRHTRSLFRISKDDGSIIWRLGGKKTDFLPIGFDLAFQHHARIRDELPGRTTISLFNNGFDGWHGAPLTHSEGLVLVIDHDMKTATVQRKYEPDYNTTLSSSQGNLETLPNGNVLIGWGDSAFITEHLEDGTTVFNASVANNGTAVYRVSKSTEWIGYPSNPPALWTYAHYDYGLLVFYVSWNGATEVRSWRFHVSDDLEGPFTPLNVIQKTGFETKHKASAFFKYAYAEALAEDGSVLDKSVVMETFVPSEKLAEACSEDGCPSAATDQPPKQKEQEAQKPLPKLSGAKVDLDNIQKFDNTTSIHFGEGYSATQAIALVVTLALIAFNIIEAFRTMGKRSTGNAWWKQQNTGPSLEEVANFR